MEISLIGKRIHVPKLVGDWLEFDRAFSAKVMGGDRGRMTIKELEYGAAQIAIILAVAACGLVEGGSKKIEPTKDLSNPISPLSFYVSESNAKGNPGLIQQLNLIKSQASPTFGSCVPYLIHQEEGDKSINIGICAKDKDKNNKAKVLVVDYIKPNSPTMLVNKETVMRREGNDIVLSYLDDQGNRVDLVTFPDKSTNFQLFLGWGVQVAQAAEIDTPTPTATVTATAIPATPTKEVPTLVPTEKPGVHVDNYMGHQGWSASIDIIKSGGSDISADTIKLWTNDPLKRPHDLVFVSTVNNNIEAPEYGRLKGVGLDVMKIAAYEVRDVRVIAQNGEELNGVEVNVKLIYMRNGSPHVLSLPIRGGFGLGGDRWIADPIEFPDLFKVGDWVNMDLAFDDGVGRFDREGIIDYWANGNDVLRQVYQIAFDGLGDHPVTSDWINQKLSQSQVDFGNGNVVVINISHR